MMKHGDPLSYLIPLYSHVANYRCKALKQLCKRLQVQEEK